MARSVDGHAATRAGLSRTRVIAEAVALADERGVEALTMRRLAERLGVEPMSLYHHVSNKEAILDGMVDVVFTEILLPKVGAPWLEEMRARAHSARTVLKRHPWAVGRLESRLNPGPATLRHHDAVIGCLRAAGFSTPLTAHAFSLMDAYLYGFAHQELALPFHTPEETAAIVESYLDQFPADVFPHLAAFTVEHVLVPGYDFGDEFGIGLDLVLGALDRALAAS